MVNPCPGRFDFRPQRNHVRSEERSILTIVRQEMEQTEIMQIRAVEKEDLLMGLVVPAQIGGVRPGFLFRCGIVNGEGHGQGEKITIAHRSPGCPDGIVLAASRGCGFLGRSKALPMDDYDERFGGVARLVGREGASRLRSARVAVIGIGGVGTWAVEALARSGVGSLTLVDLDEVCITNVNRQLHAFDGQIGRSKVAAMGERVRSIWAGCEVIQEPRFLTAANVREILARGFDAVIDAIDSVDSKCSLVAACREVGIPVVTCGGAGGKRDSTKVRVADVTEATNDRLLRRLRKKLRQDYGFSRDETIRFGIPSVYSVENAVYPWSDGRICSTVEPGAGARINCDAGLGTAAFVTGAFGLAAAGEVVRLLTAQLPKA